MPTPVFVGAAALGPGLPWVNEWRSRIELKPLLLSHPSPPPHLLLPTLAESPACSPAELARVIHVGARLYVPFFRVVDGGGSGVSPTQDEHEAVEGDGGRVLVVCGESRPGRSGRCSGLLSPFLPQGTPRGRELERPRVTDRPVDMAQGQEAPAHGIACPRPGGGIRSCTWAGVRLPLPPLALGSRKHWAQPALWAWAIETQ